MKAVGQAALIEWAAIWGGCETQAALVSRLRVRNAGGEAPLRGELAGGRRPLDPAPRDVDERVTSRSAVSLSVLRAAHSR